MTVLWKSAGAGEEDRDLILNTVCETPDDGQNTGRRDHVLNFESFHRVELAEMILPEIT